MKKFKQHFCADKIYSHTRMLISYNLLLMQNIKYYVILLFQNVMSVLPYSE